MNTDYDRNRASVVFDAIGNRRLVCGNCTRFSAGMCFSDMNEPAGLPMVVEPDWQACHADFEPVEGKE